ncbi:MAG: response regulator [Pseudomonadota bacterium]|nr:response regulator [Pseudomonadota bacterium]
MNSMLRIVVVEDDTQIATLVRDLLLRENYAVSIAASGRALDVRLAQEPADLILLDLMLPAEDGLSICRRLRAASQVPIIMLTAKGEDIDRIVGLELGADDYIAKPFNPRELVARVRAVLRRTAPAAASVAPGTSGERVRFAGFAFDLAARRLARTNGSEVDISAGDFDLLSVFVRHPQRVLSRDQLMDFTRGRSWEAFDRSIDVALSRLRRKIESDPSHPQLIKTVRNGGYMLAVPVEPCSA